MIAAISLNTNLDAKYSERKAQHLIWKFICVFILSKQCWVCFATEEDDYSTSWISPCKCRGTAKWVHKGCLERWIDEKQHGNSTTDVLCPQCNTKYIILYPKSGVLIKLIEKLDQLINKLCPYVATCVFIGSVFWTTVTYGAMTVMQVLDQKDAFKVMDQADPLIMLIALPSIPIMLVLCRFIKWEEFLLKYWRKYSNKLPVLNILLQNGKPPYLYHHHTETLPYIFYLIYMFYPKFQLMKFLNQVNIFCRLAKHLPKVSIDTWSFMYFKKVFVVFKR